MQERDIKILIVDDMPSIVTRLIHVVETGKMTLIATAASGYEAITTCIDNPCDVVLMDASMETPRAGVYACREILKLSPNTKIIIMLDESPENDNEMIFRAFQYGAVNVIRKSSNEAIIRKVIYDAYTGRIVLDSDVAPQIIAEIRRMKNTEDNYRYLIDVFLKLTPSELNILKLLFSGMPQRDIAKFCFIAPTTLKTHISHILQKFKASNIRQVMNTIRQTNFFSLIK
jgi:DNA-binding NarL/FixJ family response regulator